MTTGTAPAPGRRSPGRRPPGRGPGRGPGRRRESTPGRVRRQVRIGWRITALNFRAQLEYRSEFVLSILFGVIWQASVLVFAAVLLNRFGGLGGWSKGEVLLIVAMRLLSHGLFVAVFGNLAYLARIVQEGRIDGFLLRPMPVYRQVLLCVFNLNGLGDLTVAATLFWYALSQVSLDWTAGRVAYLVVALIGGMLVEAGLQTALACAVLRFPGATGWNFWLDELLASFGNYPLRILPGAAQFALTFVLPVAFVAYFPAATLTGHAGSLGVPGWLVMASPLAGPVVYLAARWLWARTISHYTSVGG